MARAATVDELVKLRADGQRSKLYLAIHTPTVLFSARVNQTAFIDPMHQVTYDGGSGSLGSVLPGMTMYVGTSVGAWDKGLVRIRKTPSGTVFYIGETSEIAWADNDYLTVVDELGLWPKHVRLVGTTPFMDYDIGYSDQHADLTPYPNLGPAAVLWLPTGGTVDFTPDGSGSWVLGSTIANYLWAAPGASATANLNTATPTVTYNAAGTFRVSCTVTAVNGKTAIGYRYIHIFSVAAQPVTDFELTSCRGDYDDGGWEFGLRLYSGMSAIRPRSRVILFAEDWYGAAAGSIGPVAGAENIVAMGWIDEESITPNPETGQVDFTVKGAQHWLKNMTGYPIGIERSSGAATAWTQMPGLTVDRGLWHLLHWRSTVSACMDAYLPGSLLSLPAAEAAATSIWEQIEVLAEQPILAHAACDRAGRLYVEVDLQFLDATARTDVPVVMEITQDDFIEICIERAPTRRCSMLEISGIIDDSNGPVMSRAQGGVFTLYGSAQSVENLLLDNQAAANILSGNIFAYRNIEYPNVDIRMAQNNRMIDICPRQRVTLTIAASDSPRGIVWTAKKLVARRIEHKLEKSGFLSAGLECEEETGGSLAIPGQTVVITDPPIIGDSDIGFDLPDFDAWGSWPALTPLVGGFVPPKYIPDEPQIPIVPGATCPLDAPANGPYVVPISGVLSVEHTWSMYGGIGAVVRTNSHGNRTTYELRGTFEKLVDGVWVETNDDSWYEITAINASGAVVATGIHNGVTDPNVRTGFFDAIASTPIAYLHLRIKDGEIRPTEVTAPSDTSHFWWPITNYGEVHWGPIGPGIWANVMGIEIAGSTSTWAFGTGGFINGGIIAKIQVGAQNEFLNRALHIKNSMYELYTNGFVDAYASGSFSGQGNWQEGPIAPAGAYLTKVHEFDAVADAFATSVTNIGGNVPANTPSFLITAHAFLVMMPKALYRMNLNQTTLWNVCPRSS